MDIGTQVHSISETRVAWLERKIVRWGWLIIVCLGILLLLLEILEVHFFPETPIHFYEIAMLGVLMTVVGFLQLLLLRELNNRWYNAKIDELTQQLLLDLTLNDSLTEVAEHIVQYPGSLIQVSASDLWNYDPVLHQLERIAQFGEDQAPIRDPRHAPRRTCQECILARPNTLHGLDECKLYKPGLGENHSDFCLPLSYGQDLIGLLHFRTPAGSVLSKTHIDVLNHVGLVMAIALKTTQERRLSFDEEIRAAALIERRSLSQDLHDNLAQNISYLRFKLDQITRNGKRQSVDAILADLARMGDIAAESSEVVRGRLSYLQPGQAFHISQLLQEQARLISHRADIEISILENGLPLALDRHYLRHVYYTIREALINVEKHSRASHAEINLNWGEKDLAFEIVDNGVGFDSQAVDRNNHYGLTIMRERVDEMRGQFSINGAPGGGTRVSVWLPIPEPNEVENAVLLQNFRGRTS